MRITGFGYLFREGFKNVWNNRIMSIASVCVLVSCLVLTGSAVLFSRNVAKIVDSVSDTNETTFYVDENLKRAVGRTLGPKIERLDNIEKVEYYSKDDAIAQYKDYLGEDIFERISDEDNPLPDAYKVKMKDISKYEQTVEQVMKIKGIKTVVSRRETAKKLTRINNLVQTLSLWIVIALAVISLFIISNTIRATMHNRRFEISIMKSVGATNSFVRIPFIIEGMTLGLIAAVISTVAMVFLYDGIMKVVTSVIPFKAIPMKSVILFVAAAFVVAGMLIGAVSGIISIRKYLKKEGNEILGW